MQMNLSPVPVLVLQNKKTTPYNIIIRKPSLEVTLTNLAIFLEKLKKL